MKTLPDTSGLSSGLPIAVTMGDPAGIGPANPTGAS